MAAGLITLDSSGLQCRRFVQLVNDLEQRPTVERLLDISGRALLQAAERIFLRSFRRHDDDRYRRDQSVALHLVQELQAAHAGHVDIEQNQVDQRIRAENLEPFQAIVRMNNVILLEHNVQHLMHELRIVDDENALGFHMRLPIDPL